VFHLFLIKNDDFQICLKGSNNLITNNVTTPPVIRHEKHLVKDRADSIVNIIFCLLEDELDSSVYRSVYNYNNPC
jgi:hypothetical protein